MFHQQTHKLLVPLWRNDAVFTGRRRCLAALSGVLFLFIAWHGAGKDGVKAMTVNP